jgi:nucleoside-diphosphate-sugar epimerase
MRIAVLGAGLIGRLLAWQCLEKGHQITIFDKGEKYACAFVAAGMISPFAEVLEREPQILDWGVVHYNCGLNSLMHSTKKKNPSSFNKAEHFMLLIPKHKTI